MLILERFEGNVAVIENGDEHIETEIENCSAEVKEGDVLVLRDGVYCTDEVETEKQRLKIKNLQDSLWG